MSCDDQRARITAYFDGELDPASALAVERHLEQCPSCARNLAAERALRAALQAADLRYQPTRAQVGRLLAVLRKAAPAGEEAQGAVDVEPGVSAAAAAGAGEAGASGAARSGAVLPWVRPTTFPAGRSWQRLDAVAAGLLIAVLSFVAGRAWPAHPADSGASEALAHEVVSSHVRSLLAGHLADVPSSDRHTVKPWFAGKLDYAPQVYDLAAAGFPLAGGRLDYIDGHPVAALVYRAGPHTVNLFTWPAPAPAATSSPAITEKGFHLLHWNQDGMTWWLVSDASADRLQDLARRLRAQSAGQ